MKEGKLIIGALFTAMLLTGCGGSSSSSGGDTNNENNVGTGDINGGGGSAGGDLSLTPEKGILDDETFSYNGEIKSIAVTGKAFDPMFGLADAGNATACVGMDDRYYENGLVRVYSDGGATDAQLKDVGDAAMGTLEMAIASTGYDTTGFMGEFYSNLHPKTVNRLLNEYAYNGVPAIESDGSGGEVTVIYPLHWAAFDVEIYLTDAEKALFDNGQFAEYRDAVSKVILSATPQTRRYILEQVQQALVYYEYRNPNDGMDTPPTIASPSWEGSAEQAYMEANYPDLFVDAQVDEVFNVCVLTEGNIPTDFESENGINSVTVAEDISYTNLGVAMAEEVTKQIASTYRFDYVKAMPEWFKEGVAYSLLDRNIQLPDAGLLVEAGIPGQAADNDKLNAIVVMALENANGALFMPEIYLNQRAVTYVSGDAATDGFEAVFEAMVSAPNYPNLTYDQFVSNFESIMTDLL